MLRPVSCCAALMTVAIFVSGCGEAEDPSRPKRVPVQGTVTYNGAPVEGATVFFFPQGGHNHVATGRTNAEGEYQLQTFESGDGAVPGEFTVSIRKTELVYEGGAAPVNASDDAPAPPSTEKHLLPERYADASTSGFQVTVKPAETNVFPFDLEGEVTNARMP